MLCGVAVRVRCPSVLVSVLIVGCGHGCAPVPGVWSGAGARVVLLSGAWWLVAEGVFEGGECGALGGGADFAVDVGGGVQVCVAQDA